MTPIMAFGGVVLFVGFVIALAALGVWVSSGTKPETNPVVFETPVTNRVVPRPAPSKVLSLEETAKSLVEMQAQLKAQLAAKREAATRQLEAVNAEAVSVQAILAAKEPT